MLEGLGCGLGDKGIVVRFSTEENSMLKAFRDVKFHRFAKNRNTCWTAWT